MPSTPQLSFDVQQNNSVSYFLLDSSSDYKGRQRLHCAVQPETGRSSSVAIHHLPFCSPYIDCMGLAQSHS